MWSPRHVLVTLFLCLLAVSLLFGCRAFEPEAIIVNRAPETYIIGSPAETSGAYFHFHVFWYGTDADGYVERFVWALTDTSIQDPETDDDEEDLNFNPATNSNTLEIGTYTTRTDSIFDFRIDQGANLSYDMTLHMVAVDDRGDFDRTPARLHFFSNALGQPRVQFYRDQIAPGNEFSDYDTVAYHAPLFLRWSGSTPNIYAYDPELLAERDTVLPYDDGLFGFKWRVPDCDDCNDAQEDCWNPKAFDEATGDSFSYFGNVTALDFRSDGSGPGCFGQVLPAQILQVLVNTIDVAGVQVPALDQTLNIVINYDPDTYILRNEPDPVDDHNDDMVYPYYEIFDGPEADIYSFSEGDTVPDGAYVHFKALGWDDPRDQQLGSANNLTFQGQFIAGQNIRINGIYFEFTTTYSDTHSTGEWKAADAADWDNPSADTLGFEVGPFNYSVVMRAVDEQGTRDGTPDTFKFVGNYPPCVQCVEIMNRDFLPQNAYEDPCYDIACLEGTPELEVYQWNGFGGDPRYDADTDPNCLTFATNTNRFMWVNASAGAIVFQTDRPAGDPAAWLGIQSTEYHFMIYMSGKDHPREFSELARDRIKAWRYQVDYDLDVGGAISDGGGSDNINFLSGFNINENNPDPQLSDFYVIPTTGVWGNRVTVAVPNFLFIGPGLYWNYLRSSSGYNCPPLPAGSQADTLAWQANPAVQKAYRAWKLTLMQFSPGTVQVIAADNSTCDWRQNTNMYHYYDGTRNPTPNGRRCEDAAYEDPDHPELGNIDLQDFIAYSNNQVPVTKDFSLNLYLPNASPEWPDINVPFTGNEDPPYWISETKKQQAWR